MTFSVVGRCARTRQLGVAVASHAVAVGAVVPWAVPGVAAGATQSVHSHHHTRELKRMLADGIEPAAALAAVIAADDGAALRQIGVLDAAGRGTGYTGVDCITFAGHVVGQDVVAQGNMLAADGLWTVMAEQFDAAPDRDLVDRLVIALRAAEAGGGDVRGRQAAAVLVVGAEPDGDPVVDVRVDDHPDPIAELERLVALQRADEVMRAALDRGLHGGAVDPAVADLMAAQQAFGANLEPTFWACVVRGVAGCPDAAELDVITRNRPAWGELYQRMFGGEAR